MVWKRRRHRGALLLLSGGFVVGSLQAALVWLSTSPQLFGRNLSFDFLPTIQPKRPTPTLYWNLSCPLESSKLSQVFMASRRHLLNRTHNNVSDTEEEEIHGLRRAWVARNFSEQHHSLERLDRALQAHSFQGRRIVFEGDSLTRQLFTATACLAWSNGYLQAHMTEWRELTDVDYQRIATHFPGFSNKGPHSQLLNSVVKLRGGGQLMFKDRYPTGGRYMYKRSVSQARYKAWTQTCARQEPLAFDETTNLTSVDVIVINAGLHPDRNSQVDTIKTMIQACQGALYPHFVYMLTPLQHFWTRKGDYDARQLKDDKWTCRPTVPDLQRQYGDINHFGNLTTLLGKSLDQRDLGDLMIWRGDCTHWIMPGMHDVLAAELADILKNLTLVHT